MFIPPSVCQIHYIIHHTSPDRVCQRLNGRNVFGCYGRIICVLFVKIIIGHLEQILVMGR